jgi:hypothetical protein
MLSNFVPKIKAYLRCYLSVGACTSTWLAFDFLLFCGGSIIVWGVWVRLLLFGSGGGFYGWWVIKRVSNILLGKKVWSSLR